MNDGWRERVAANGFSELLPYLDARATDLDGGVLDEQWLQGFGLAPEDLRALAETLRPSGAATLAEGGAPAVESPALPERNAWRDRVAANGFAEVLPHLEAHSEELDVGQVDAGWLHELGLAPEDVAALIEAIRGSSVATTTHTPTSFTAQVSGDVSALARARVLRAIAAGDTSAAAAALASMAMPTDADGRVDFASWLSAVTLARPTKDPFVNAAVGVSFALQMSCAQVGPVPDAVLASVQAISDHVAHLQRGEVVAQARQQRLILVGAVVLVLITIAVVGAYVAVQALNNNADAITTYLLMRMMD